ncbi:protein-export chaperone SecB [Denitrificimonas sp. JX-1]|uniref:Protein-export chaperone SecB n=1 Tax=Denitrificimonas halotolerans TaxID=3098930 RepID=A0ABU5GUU5_9GAMM|nr:protein-export chaperone SecB [Denitrificimonas sp. JX-1]MDY7219403.1 protein-export chaperone SecB [Denitrificimonas sp. JX-1]
MKLSPLQLKHYHYSHLQLESVDSEQLMEKDASSPYWVPAASKIKISITVGEPETREKQSQYVFIISLQLNFQDKDFPYKFVIALDGVFVCDDLEEPSEKFQHELVVNATSLLYSSVREQLLTLSSRQKYGPLMLPSLDFRSLERADAGEEA